MPTQCYRHGAALLVGRMDQAGRTEDTGSGQGPERPEPEVQDGQLGTSAFNTGASGLNVEASSFVPSWRTTSASSQTCENQQVQMQTQSLQVLN